MKQPCMARNRHKSHEMSLTTVVFKQVVSDYNTIKLQCAKNKFYANSGNKLHLIKLLPLFWQWLCFILINRNCIINTFLLVGLFLVLLTTTSAACSSKENKNQHNRDSQSSSAGKRQTMEPFAELFSKSPEFTMMVVTMMFATVFLHLGKNCKFK